MDRTLNPYAPGSGISPKALEGRDAEIESIDTIVARARHGLHSRAIVLSGLRGVGKTVLLNAFRLHAKQRDWITVPIEARSTETGRDSVRAKLARELVVAARSSKIERAGEAVKSAFGSITSFSASLGMSGVSLGVDRAVGRADSGVLEVDLEEMVTDVATAMKDKGLGFAIFVDEMQDLDEELLTALLAAQHAAGQDGLPFYVFGAGLPNLPSVLSEARSYAERLFEYRQIGPLVPDAARRALSRPAQEMGASFDDDALTRLVEAADGYPYFLQEYGKAVWDVAPARPFTLADAEAAVVVGTAQLDQGFFPARWDRATPGERAYLQAMARDGERGSRTSDVATRLGRGLSSLGPTRSELIKKGLIYSPEHGRISYTVPGMADFIRRQFSDQPEVGRSAP